MISPGLAPRLHVPDRSGHPEDWAALVAAVASLVGLEPVAEPRPAATGKEAAPRRSSPPLRDSRCRCDPRPGPPGTRVLRSQPRRRPGASALDPPSAGPGNGRRAGPRPRRRQRPAIWEGAGHYARACHDELHRHRQVGTAKLRFRSGRTVSVLGALARAVDLVVVCWDGQASAERVPVLKEVLPSSPPPVLLLRSARPKASRGGR